MQPTQVESINLLFSVLFGFQKEEIIGKDLSSILPNLFVDYHETLINQMNENINLGSYQSTYLNTS